MRATGSAAPARYGGHRRPVLKPHEADLRRFCSRGLYLREGELIADGPIEDTLEAYNIDLGTVDQ